MKFIRKKFIFSFLFCAIQLHCLNAKKFGGGGGFRGGGAARANPAPAGGHFGGGGAPVGGGQPHFAGGGAGGFHGPTGGGFHPPPAGGGFHGPPMSAGTGPGRFGSGTGLGSSSRAGTFTTALAGAAVGTVGGLVAFEAGKAIIHSFDRPFQHDGRNYYLDEKYAKKQHGEIQCKVPWDKLVNQSPAATTNQTTNGTSPEQTLANATFPNGSRPKEVVWTCKENVEICCGTDCCPNPNYSPPNSEAKSGGGMGTVGKVLLGIVVVSLLFCCCCALLTYTSCRSVFDSCMPGNNTNQNYDQNNHPYKYDGASDNVHNPSAGQAYPMQPYYPPASNNYPAQPQAQAVYPPAPTYPAQPQAQAVYPPNPTSYPQAHGY
ncbi:hypothetical protein niasHT_037090 [Heterodera trifolii]|uniref:CX domain-containing protein n=1 Tax=Heterodera trifolii TaxID=157864 RepID=A0ABD2IRY0_9BILA